MTTRISDKALFWFKFFLSDESFWFLLTIENNLLILTFECVINKTQNMHKICQKYSFSLNPMFLCSYLRFCSYTGIYESEQPIILVYFTQWQARQLLKIMRTFNHFLGDFILGSEYTISFLFDIGYRFHYVNEVHFVQCLT